MVESTSCGVSSQGGNSHLKQLESPAGASCCTWLDANAASLQARRKVRYPEEAATQAVTTAAETAEWLLFSPGNWPFLQCGVSAAAAALAYEAAASGKVPPVKPWPAVFADEDEE